jgi:ubiquinone/menaquinone biosynthesis C-methylase UbiE
MNMDFKTFFSNQAKQPSGLFGRLVMPWVFDRGNAPLHYFMRETLAVREDDHVLEIGFGTGRLIAEIAGRARRGLVEGIDISDTMTAMASELNKDLIAAGRVKLTLGNFDQADYRDAGFNVVCSANTLYFWPDAKFTAAKILRVLKPGGRLFLGFADRSRLGKSPLAASVFHMYEKDDVAKLLKSAGFSDVTIKSQESGAYLAHCAVAVK